MNIQIKESVIYEKLEKQLFDFLKIDLKNIVNNNFIVFYKN